MPFQSSLARSVGKLLKTYNQQDLGLRGSQNRLRGIFEASGGNEYQPGNGYKYHIFTSPGTLSVTATGDLDYFVVAGGGGGGSNCPPANFGGSGGGAGGVVTGSIAVIDTGNYPVVIGTGGAVGPTNPNEYAGNGTNSSISPLGIVAHGGGGGYNGPGVGSPGGSGSGGGYGYAGGYGYNPTTPAPILAGASPALPSPYTITQGYPGGPSENSPGTMVPTAGGGGAGGPGEEACLTATTIGSRGGLGVAVFNGDTGIPNSYGTPGISAGRWFAGGGGGSGPSSQTPTGAGVNVCGNGGYGGGANGSNGTNNSSNAAVNSGGGGGGGAYNHPAPDGSAGADGIVILRYLDGTQVPVLDPFYGTGGDQTGGPGALEPGNGYKYNTFTASGNFVVPGSVSPGYVEVLIVAGGGGGASFESPANAGAGGGGGGLLHHASYHVEAGTTYPIVIGQGGLKGGHQAGGPYFGSNGQNSTAFGMIALGGGGAGGYDATNGVGHTGGSGGGGISAGIGTQTGNGENFWFRPNPNFNQYGHDGGLSSTALGDWGGGGGAGAAGEDYHPLGTNLGGKGGNGRQYPQFTGNLIGVPGIDPYNGYFAGGGGGGNYPDGAPSDGGLGGGGGPNNNPILSPPDTQPIPGSACLGGGGAGGSGSVGSAGSGGHGIVIIRYVAN